MRRWVVLAAVSVLILVLGSFLANAPLGAQGGTPEASPGASPVASPVASPSACPATPAAASPVAGTTAATSAASVTVSPEAAAPGSAITLTVFGMAPGERVAQYWGTATRPGAAATADHAGTAVINRKVPNVPAGAVTLRVAGETSGRTASVSFTVTAASANPNPAALGTPPHPVPFCTPFDVPYGVENSPTRSAWTITVTGVTPNADQAIQAASQGSSPKPAAGHQYFMVTLRVTYHGSRQAFGISNYLSFAVVGTSGTIYGSAESPCGTGSVPNPLPNGAMSPGATAAGNVCWTVNSGDVSSLAMYVSPGVSVTTEHIFFSVTP